MRLKQAVAAISLVALAVLVGCSRDPNVVKKRYLESGNKYYGNGKYKEARIMYMDALQKDQRYGEAHYHLGLTALKIGPVLQAVNSLRRAVELLPKDNPDHWDAVVRLSEVYLIVAREQKQILDEVETYCKELLQRDPNSFDGHRLTADLDMARSALAYQVSNKDEGLALLRAAVQEYNRANSIKPGNEGVLMQTARAHSAMGEYAEAERVYRDLIEKNKTFEVGYRELYRLYVFQRKLPEAEQVLKTAFQNNPKQFDFETMLALHYSLTNRRAEMATVLQTIKAHAQEYDQAYLVVGDFYLRLGDGDTAIREYKEGMAKDAKKKSTYEKRIIEVYLSQGRRAEAAELNAQVLKQDPTDSYAQGLAATFLLDKGEVSRAITDLSALVTRSPDNPVGHFQLGRAHAARGEFEQARQQFTKAIELRPDYIVARLALAQLQVIRGEYDAALKTAEQTLQVDRNSLSARLIQSASLMGLHKYPEARELLGSMLRVAPNSADVHFQLGVLNLADKKFKESADSFRRSYELNPANPRGLMGLVETEMAQSRPDQALQLLRSESDKNPNSKDLRLALGNIAVRSGKYDEALQAYNQVLSSLESNSKQRGDIYLRIGETYRIKGDEAASVAALQKAREALPDNVTIASTLALVLDRAGRWSEARQAYEAALKLDANNGIGLNNLAFLMAEHSGDLDDALTKAQKAKQLLPNTYEVSDTLGWIYLKKNLTDNAIDTFRDLVTKAPNQSTFRYHLGMALFQKGDKPKAIKELNDALKYNPAKDERDKIQQLLTRLSGA